MNTLRVAALVAFAAGLLMATDCRAQAGTGNLYNVTTKMEIQGMPFQMPPRTQQVCGPKDQASEAMVPKDKDCTVTDYRVTGNKSTFRMVCTGQNPMTGTGEFERLGADAYRGRMQVQGKMEGEPMDMTMSFEGKKIRDCDYATESPQAVGNAMLAKTCADMIRMPTYASYQSFAVPGAICAGDKTRYCNAITSAETTPDHVRTGEQVPMYWEAMQACGLNRAAVLAKTCPKAEASRDYAFVGEFCPSLLAKSCATADAAKNPDFVVQYCPAQAQTVAAAQCAGRDYTALRASAYGNFCSRYAGGQLQARNANGTATPPPATPAAPKPEEDKKPSWRDRLKSARDAITGD